MEETNIVRDIRGHVRETDRTMGKSYRKSSEFRVRDGVEDGQKLRSSALSKDDLQLPRCCCSTYFIQPSVLSRRPQRETIPEPAVGQQPKTSGNHMFHSSHRSVLLCIQGTSCNPRTVRSTSSTPFALETLCLFIGIHTVGFCSMTSVAPLKSFQSRKNAGNSIRFPKPLNYCCTSSGVQMYFVH